MEQSLPLASLAGITAGLAGAILWGAISVATGYQIGYLAIAIGALVGFSIRYFGKGIDPVFGVTGAALAVLSCFVGNFFSIIGVLANQESLGYLETFLSFDYAYFVPVMSETFSPVDLFFYGLAGYEGYKFSFRQVTEEEIAILKKR